MKDIFITSTLKSDWNLQFNPLLCAKLEEKGVDCYLPQRDTDQEGDFDYKYEQNIGNINNVRRVLAIWANESINRWLETGYAFGSGKEVILLTDKDHFIPVMSRGMYYKVLKVDNLDDVDSYIDELVDIIKN